MKLKLRDNRLTTKLHLTRWGIVALAVVIALASVGVTYAGIKGPKPPKDKPVPTAYCSDPFTWVVSNDNGAEESGGVHSTIDPGDLGPDPYEPQTAGTTCAREDKDVAKTEAKIGYPTDDPPGWNDDPQIITVTISNAYPCYYPTVLFALECPDSQQGWITAINTDDVPSALTVTTSGIVEGELPIPIPTGGEVVGALHVHVEQEAEECHTYEFSVSIETECKIRKSGTAYAYGGDYANCFFDYGFKNWGWTNGELEPDFYGVFPLYVGASDCLPSEEKLVGTVTIDYNAVACTVTVTYNITDTDTDYTMYVTHVWVGEKPFPRDKKGNYTASPGKYGNTHKPPDSGTSDTFIIDLDPSLCGEQIYVIAHAGVFWFE